MTPEPVRLLVIGAGVNGSALALLLHNAGLDVRVLARGSRLEQLRSDGIVIENPMNGKRLTARVPVIDYLHPEDRYEYVFVVVRKNQVAELLPVLAQNNSPNMVFLGNNLSGPEEFTRALDPRRILLGTVVAGGKREGGIIRAMILASFAPISFGELDGSITPRLERLVALLRGARIKAVVSTNMIDHQRTHAAGVALIGTLVMKYGCDLRALSRSREDMRRFVLARRESHQVLRALGYEIIPPSEATELKAPVWLQMLVMRWMLNSKFGEVGLAYHVSQAPDEVQQLAKELAAMVEASGLPVPAIRQVLGMEAGGTPANNPSFQSQSRSHP